MGERELVIGKTELGEWKENGTVFKVFYGNYLTPHKNGCFQHVGEEEYESLLDSFLKSERGRAYKVPTSAENQNAINIVLQRESAALESAKVKAKESEKHKEKKSPVYVTEDIPEEFKERKEPALEETKESKPKAKREKHSEETSGSDSKLYKRQVGILTIAVLFLTLVVVMQMLLNLYLLTR